MTNAFPYRHILVWIDGTDASERACAVAINMARAWKSRLTAVSVVETETLGSLFKQRLLVLDEMQEFEAELTASAEKYLRNAADTASKAGLKMATVLLKGASHSAILGEQVGQSPDLIIMGTFNSANIHRDLTARGRQLVVDGAQCPVLLVP